MGERLRLDQMARSGLEPRIPNLQIRSVPVDGGRGWVLIVRVSRSYAAPHRVIFQKRNKFYARSSAGRYEPNVDELRALFAFAPQLAERMRDFRLDRIARIVAGDVPVRLMDDCCLVLHVVPFSHFDLRPALSLPAVIDSPGRFPPMRMRSPNNWRVNFDGFLTLYNANAGAAGRRAYVQVFRTGAVEAVASSITDADGHLNIEQLDFMIVQSTRAYARALHECGADPPLAVLASAIGVKGRRLVRGFDTFTEIEGELADRDQLHLNEVMARRIAESDVREFEIGSGGRKPRAFSPARHPGRRALRRLGSRVLRFPPAKLSRMIRKSSIETCVNCGLPAHSPIAQVLGAVVSSRSLTRI
jgi:hypothetical protein